MRRYGLENYGRYAALAVLGGQVWAEGPFWQRVRQQFMGPSAQPIWVADGGLDFCQAEGLRPQRVLGDLDSLSERSRAWLEELDCPLERFSTDKDQTDGELCLLSLCRALPPGSCFLILAGCGGERLDHVVCHLQLLQRLAGAGYRPVLTDGRCWVLPLHGPTAVALPPCSGEQPPYLVSLLADFPGLGPLDSEGLAYELKGKKLNWAQGYGLSNYPLKSAPLVRLSSEGGQGLVICSQDEGSISPRKRI